MISICIKTCIAVVIFILILSFLGFCMAIYPLHKVRSKVTPDYYSLAFEDVILSTHDNVNISGWFIKSKQPTKKTILILHGYPADKGDLLPGLMFLSENFNLLFIDFRSFGRSGGNYTTLGAKEKYDVAAAITYLEDKGFTPVGIYGFSFGGSVALLSAANHPEVKAVISDSSFAKLEMMLDNYYNIPLLKYPLMELTRLWGLMFLNEDVKNISPVDSAYELSIPILIIHSKSDLVIPFKHAKAYQDKLKDNANVEFVFTKGKKHGEFSNDYKDRIKGFFDKHL